MDDVLQYRVADIMTYRPLTVGRHATLSEAARLLEEHDVGCLPVADDGVLVGVVTKLDILYAVAPATHDTLPAETLMSRAVESVMNDNPYTVTPDMPLTRLLEMLVETDRRSFPVVHGALLLGIVTRGDALRALRRAATGRGPLGRNGHPG